MAVVLIIFGILLAHIIEGLILVMFLICKGFDNREAGIEDS